MALCSSLIAMALVGCQKQKIPDVKDSSVITTVDTINPESYQQNFVLVEGGTTYPDDGIYTAGLTVASYYIDKHEYTSDVWESVKGSEGCNNYPLTYVSWFGAIEFCNRFSKKSWLSPCYSYLSYGTNPDNWPSEWNTDDNHVNKNCDFHANGYRLPTEAEWEYPARGGLQKHGYTYGRSNDLNEVGWYKGNSYVLSKSVGQLAPNYWGYSILVGAGGSFPLLS